MPGNGSSHRKWRNPKTGKSTEIVETLKYQKPGTLRSIVKQAGYSIDGFIKRYNEVMK